ncbi:MAG: OFA family MFS transporter [Deltaproteobacteria bacterium]|nr:OFA family MFS transporter [Deltaproteobacteria bacterium]
MMNRWFRVAGGVAMNLCFGAAYAWSVFLAPLQKEFGWTRAEVSVAFTLSIACIATGVLIGGRWQDRKGPAPVALTGALLFSAGIFLSRYTHSLLWLYVFYGVLVGFASGVGYTCPLAVGMKWFPDRRGLVTGLMVMGYGAGGALIAPLAGLLIDLYGWRDTFALLGMGFFFVTIAGSFFVRNPPEGWSPEGWTPPPPGDGAFRTLHDFAPGEMLRTRAFCRMWPAYALGTTAGLMVIGHLAAFAQGAGFSRPDAALSVGVLAVGNGCGRIGSGWLSDHIGRTRTLALVMGLTAVLLFFEPDVSTRPFLFVSVFLIGYCYGSQLAVFPSATADFFGVSNIGNNYGLVVTAWGTAGIIGPMLGGWLYDATKSYTTAFLIAALLALLASLLVSTVKPPKPPSRPRGPVRTPATPR